jgi:hypothetical protein
LSNYPAFAELELSGAVLLPRFFVGAALTKLREAAARCFESIETAGSIPERYRFSASSNSVLLSALLDFGCEWEDDLLGPLASPQLQWLFTESLRHPWVCNLEQSWVRKKSAPSHVADQKYHLQGWHQDGALGACFPLEPAAKSGQVIPMTELITCWIPLQDCGRDSPGLQFVRRRQAALLHFTELEDAVLRRRFNADEFWSPTLQFGDGLIFLNDIVHRTYVHEGMHKDRLSIEYRVFPTRTTRAGRLKTLYGSG